MHHRHAIVRKSLTDRRWVVYASTAQNGRSHIDWRRGPVAGPFDTPSEATHHATLLTRVSRAAHTTPGVLPLPHKPSALLRALWCGVAAALWLLT